MIEADEMGCHIITAPADVLKKLPALGTKTAAELSLDAVKAFREDALAAGLTLDIPGKVAGRGIEPVRTPVRVSRRCNALNQNVFSAVYQVAVASRRRAC